MPNRVIQSIKSGKNIPIFDVVEDDKKTNPPQQSKCGVICQKKKKRKIIFIGLGVLLIGATSYFILRKK